MKKPTKKSIVAKEKAKTKASKLQLNKFKELFQERCENENKPKMDKTIKNLSQEIQG
jgi:hypothetical protein